MWCSLTHYEVIDIDLEKNQSRVKLTPVTGRTHQIRVHMSSLGTPVAGDSVYGKKRTNVYTELGIHRQLLHASSLTLTHPSSGKKHKFTSDLWPDMLRVIKKIKDSPQMREK